MVVYRKRKMGMPCWTFTGSIISRVSSKYSLISGISPTRSILIFPVTIAGNLISSQVFASIYKQDRMSLHETRSCPRCSQAFECKPGSITQCQCFGLQLTLEQRAYLEERYADCLCSACLRALQAEFELFKEKFIFR